MSRVPRRIARPREERETTMKRVLWVLLAACGGPIAVDRPIQVVRPVEPTTPAAVTVEMNDVAKEVTALAPLRHGVNRFTRTVSDQTTLIDLLLDSTSVFCTALG